MQKCFSVNNGKIFNNTFLENSSGRLLLDISSFKPPRQRIVFFSFFFVICDRHLRRKRHCWFFYTSSLITPYLNKCTGVKSDIYDIIKTQLPKNWSFLEFEVLKWTSHGILRYLWSANLSKKNLSQLIVSIFTFSING